ncbi:MAG: chloride channel protein, partial [Deltaproteobacteria bacterium]|nr:chloride channel protein [Deltaproteobacteria bacterium]
MPVKDRPPWKAKLESFAEAERLHRHEDKILLVLTLLIGAVVGLVIVAFIVVTERLGAIFLPEHGAPWRRLALPIAGALASGVLLARYFPGARGSGIPQTKVSLLLLDGVIHLRTVVGKFLCSSMSLASGIALGREGPAVQIGGGIASVLGRRLGLPAAQVKSLIPIGTSAAVAAAFNTPIAAVLFTLEEVLGDLHARVLGSVVLSAATSWAVLHLLLGDEPLFHVPAYQLVHPFELAVYALLGVVGGLVSVAFVKLLLALRRGFLALPARTRWLQPAAGGVVAGVLGFFVPAVLGVGYHYVGDALNGQMRVGMLALLLGLKVVATASCYASGNAGGIFGPSLFIGAMLGGVVGSAAHGVFPEHTGSAGAYALVGMGTAFAGIIRAPMTSAIMIFELTRDYTIIVPVMIANVLSYFISQRLQREPIYEALLHQEKIHLPPTRHEPSALLVDQAMRAPEEALPAGDGVRDHLAAASRAAEAGCSGGDLGVERAWPVVDGTRLLGMLTARDLEAAAEGDSGSRSLASLLPAPDPGRPSRADAFPHVHVDQPIETALQRMARSGIDVLPVVSRQDAHELLGTISLESILGLYRSKAAPESRPDRHRQEGAKPNALLATVLAGVVGLFALSAFLVYQYDRGRTATAEESFCRGGELLQQSRFGEAVEQYRNALSLSPSDEYRLALSRALMRAGQFQEATLYLREVLKSDPRSGPAALGLARAAASLGRPEAALSYYRQAASGVWAPGQESRRIEAALERAELLQKTGAENLALAELLGLEAQAEDPATKTDIGL